MKLALPKPTPALLAGAGLLLVLLPGLLFYFSPHRAASQMQAAVTRHDTQALSRQIDFPAVRDSLKDYFAARVRAEAARKGTPEVLGEFGATLTGAFISPMIDAMVTPENLALMFRGEKPEFSQPNAPASGFVGKRDIVMESGYEDFNHFVVTTHKKGSQEAPVSFVLQREGGWSWKLVALRLPLPKADTALLMPPAGPATPAALPALPPQGSNGPEPAPLPVPPALSEGEAASGSSLPPPPVVALPATPSLPGAPDNAGTPSAIPPAPADSSTASRPSFDCSKAGKVVERMICNQPELAAADVQLDQAYRDALQRTSGREREMLQQAQHQWRRERDFCGDSRCVLNAYRQRQEELIFLR